MRREGFKGVTSLVQAERKPFNQDPRGGPWAAVIKSNAEFARAYQHQEPERYLSVVGTMRNQLFDRDTAPGARPEDLLRVDVPALIVPGRDKTHATSAARYLEECLPRAEYLGCRRRGSDRRYRAAAAPGISTKSSSTVIRRGMMPCS